MTAGETAPMAIVLVIIKDCHASHNEVVEAKTPRDERRIRLTAMSKGYLVAVRKPKQPGCETHCTTMPTNRTWRKPAAIAERPRPKLFGAFSLTLTASAMEGGGR